MISIVPYYRKQRQAVVIRVIAHGHLSKTVNTGIKVKPSQWNEKEKKVIDHPNKKIFNQKIQSIVHELQSQITKADLLGTIMTPDRVKRIAEGGTFTTSFFDHCESWIKEKYSNPGTAAAAMSDLRKIKQFAPSLQFGDIDRRWLMRYERHLRENRKNVGNTPWKAMKFIRTMIYDAESIGGLVAQNPFKTGEYKMPRYIQPEKDGLHIDEIVRIEKILSETHPVVIKLMAARFLFMCFTGLRVSDAKRFDPAQHLKNGERIVIKSKKTGATTNLKLFDRLRAVLDHLSSLPQKSMSDQKMNEYLKIIADLCEPKITRIKLTTHVGRHTFGCLLAEMGLSEEEAQELMGHKNKVHTKIYFRLRQPQIDRAADKLNNI
jgi:integrase/recombinase XerD